MQKIWSKLKETSDLLVNCIRKIVWVISWVLQVGFRRVNSPHEDNLIFNYSRWVQISKTCFLVDDVLIVEAEAEIEWMFASTNITAKWSKWPRNLTHHDLVLIWFISNNVSTIAFFPLGIHLFRDSRILIQLPYSILTNTLTWVYWFTYF